MAVRVFCSYPRRVLESISAKVRTGAIETWQIDDDGDFTHSPDQWKYLAWFRPVVEDDRIVFRILGRPGAVMSKATYGVYHGRFIEMLLTHFDVQFSRVTATALPAEGDIIGKR
jgi:hypothetical protein